MNLSPVNFPSILGPGAVAYYDDYTPGSRSGTWSVDETRLNRTYSRRLKVFTSSKTVGPAQVVGSIPVRIGSTYQWPLAGAATENDTGSFCQSIRADLDSEDGLQWLVTIDYGPFHVPHQLGVADVSQGIINPLDRAPEVYWSKAKYKRTKPQDESDPPLPFVNTIGDPLLDPPDTEETRPVLKFVRNESTYNDAYASQFKDCVNSSDFLGYPPNTVKCSDISGERIFDADWGYFARVTYEFEIRDDDDGNGYTKLILNAGYRQKVSGSGLPINVVDGSGNTVTDAVPLQENGAYSPTADPYFLEFTEFPQIDFSDLNIPDDLLDANE